MIISDDNRTEKLPINIALDNSFFIEEEKCGYKITRQSKQLWAVLLDLMVQFDRVCRHYNIKYCLDSGTLLGAVRHKGFIPWDNDVDVIMLRSEYDRLCEIAPIAFMEPYFWQTNETDPGSLRRHGQLRNSQTTCILKSEMNGDNPMYGFNQGVFLDVFILDEIPDDAEELLKFTNMLQNDLNLLCDFRQYYWDSGCSSWIKEAQQQAYEDFEKKVTRYNGTGQLRVANVSLLPKRKESTYFVKDFFEHLTDYSFERFNFPGPQNYDEVLTAYYDDWHELVIGQEIHGDIHVDLTKSYTNYIKKTYSRSNFDASKTHPILDLYRHRDSLLLQYDIEKNNIKQCHQELARINGLLADAHKTICLLENKAAKRLQDIRKLIWIIIVLISVLLISIWRNMTI